MQKFAFSFLVVALFITPLASYGQSAPVTVARVVSGDLMEDIPLNGTVVSPRISTLSSAVAGLVTKMNVDVGVRVKPGDILLELDSELTEIALQGARAGLESAEANYKEAQRRVTEAQPLVKQNNIAATEMSARLAQAEIAKAAVDRARAELNRQSAELKRHQVRAPFAGVISQKLTEMGEWVAPGRQVLQLVATTELFLDFQVPQYVYPRLNERAEIVVQFDAIPNQRYNADILSSVPVNSASARTFLLRAKLSDASPMITPGMSTHGALQLHSAQQGVMVPRDAVIRYSDGRTVVWTVDQSGDRPTVKERVVTLGVSSSGQVEIKTGLTSEELVVTQGNEALQPGQAVTIVNSATVRTQTAE